MSVACSTDGSTLTYDTGTSYMQIQVAQRVDGLFAFLTPILLQLREENFGQAGANAQSMEYTE